MQDKVVELAEKMAEAFEQEIEAERRRRHDEWVREKTEEARRVWERAVELEPRLKDFEAAVQFEPGDEMSGLPILRIGDWPGIAIQVAVKRGSGQKGVLYMVGDRDEEGEEYWPERLSRVWSLEHALHMARVRSELEDEGDDEEEPGPVCPLFSAGHGAQYYCIEEGCAWWAYTVGGEGMCALGVLARALNALVDMAEQRR